MVETTPTLVPDGFVYLRAEPETCMDRMKIRNRGEESAVDLKYLEDLHKRHEDWLYGGPFKHEPFQSVSWTCLLISCFCTITSPHLHGRVHIDAFFQRESSYLHQILISNWDKYTSFSVQGLNNRSHCRFDSMAAKVWWLIGFDYNCILKKYTCWRSTSHTLYSSEI